MVFGAYMAWEALKASWWAQSKEEYEWCEDHDFDYPGCEALSGKSLSIPTDPSLFERNGDIAGYKDIGYPSAHASFFMSILLVAVLWIIRNRIARVALGFLKVQHKPEPPDHQELEEVLVWSEAEEASSTNEEASLEVHPEAISGGSSGRSSSDFSDSAHRDDTHDVYRSSTAKDYKKTITSRPSAIGHSAYASGYDRNETPPSYSSSSYRAR